MATISDLNTFVSNAVLLLALAAFAGKVYSSSITLPTTGSLRQVIEAHTYAIGENRLDEAMSYYHSQSPEIVRTRQDIEFGLSQFLLKTTTLNFCYTGQMDGLAMATAKHRYLMITGVKLIEQFDDVVYQMRQEHGSWKIWTQRHGSNDRVKLSMCEN